MRIEIAKTERFLALYRTDGISRLTWQLNNRMKAAGVEDRLYMSNNVTDILSTTGIRNFCLLRRSPTSGYSLI